MTSYNALVSAVMGYTENDATEFTGALNDIINSAELEIARDLDNYGFVFHDYTSVTTSDPFLTKPTGTYVVKDLSVIVSGSYVPLRLRTLGFLRAYWPDRTSVGTPKYYANWDNETLIIAPAPISATTAEMTFTAQVSALSSAVTTNYLTDFAYNALLYKTLELSYLFMKDTIKAGEFRSKYENEKSRMLNEARRTRRDDYQTPGMSTGENTQTGSA